ncbi:hypothetical protein [Seonamhaeicola marinus]|uniref:Macroglobulin domain-containing protein n=1 Tax=Seonamhaeicola marinus TaxID=1912246 RepID=A0A5D0HZ10_9FLAO|nr:hypothetical protein [Seonamhaeicola marinus]TYA74732.1 hypothetical protein FUA24_15580 [Seonamhaeicola marinus]
MKHRIYYIYTILCLCCGTLYSQNTDSLQTKFIETLPAEDIQVVFNKNMLLAGETLYYKLYCLLQKDNALSDLSKMAYVELVGKQNGVIFNHKLKLVNGQGYGDFFIPATLKTGNYKLIAYTQWMQNSKVNTYVEKDLYIINPYISQVAELENKDLLGASVSLKNDELSISEIKKNASLNVVDKTYKPRSKVKFNFSESSLHGSFTLSVNRMSNLSLSLDEKHLSEADNDNTVEEFYLPELRGEIISGKVYHKNNGLIAPNKTIALSIPGKNYIQKTVEVDAKGKFYFNIHENYSTEDCVLQIIDSKPANFKIVLDDKSFKNKSALLFRQLTLNPNIEEWLAEESVLNQVENAYVDLKLDRIDEKDLKDDFFGNPSIIYKLDDYKRFPSLRETFIEVIEGVGIRKRSDGYHFEVFSYKETVNSALKNYDPLVLLDGVLIQDNQYLIDYNPYDIEQIGLIRAGYFYGPQMYFGIIDIRTKKATKGTYFNFHDIEGLHHLKLNLPNENKTYYTPDYDLRLNALKRIPDFRRQLLWKPNLDTNKNMESIECYTSDVEGIYEVSLKGYTKTGTYVDLKDYFEVSAN